MSTRDGVPFDPDWCMRPGVHLREMMDYAGLKGDLGVTTVARLSGLATSDIEGILSGKRRITKPIATQLACGTAPLAISAQFWLNLERQYREGLKAGKTDVSDDVPAPSSSAASTRTPWGDEAVMREAVTEVVGLMLGSSAAFDTARLVPGFALEERLGKADWLYDDELGHVPCCSQRTGTRRCGNGPLDGDRVASGNCGMVHVPPLRPPLRDNRIR